MFLLLLFQHTATRRWLLQPWFFIAVTRTGFNTQPPEGGCYAHFGADGLAKLFQHTATRRWLLLLSALSALDYLVSTHSHPKVAANDPYVQSDITRVSTHSHPKVAACFLARSSSIINGFNTQPPEGGCQVLLILLDR